ncbi:hypothetical protein [Rhodoferax mekongensis]|uniref:Type II and III secretion system protein n=1 Tax=Rhodoferax mekongensis TaxID=3068341 RepID=A0ABZ0B1M2_9BURK|nr:hypothetical protein [Rhodoferax sp. TBRC 17307]WNO05604.1 hypothetical protein RAN89_03990 [Rhodoferax sp. TBRC 17307]
MNSGANATPLPLRNLLIEVRQVQSEDGQQAGVDLQGGRVTGGLAQGRSSGTAVQQILILNGRPARIAVQTQTPLRLLQSFVRNGHIVSTQGTVLIEAGTGFSALPRWEGGDVVEVELNTQQPLRPLFPQAGAVNAPPAQSSTGSSMLLPLGEWMTVAETEQNLQNNQQSLRGAHLQSGVTRTEVQLRVSLR